MNKIIERVKSIEFSKIKTKDLFSLLEDLFSLVKKTNKNIDVKEIYDKIFPILAKNIDGNTLLEKIYNISELNDYCMYLLHNNKVDLSTISIDVLMHLIYNTTWGKRFFLDNIDIISQDRIPKLIPTIYNNDITLYYLILSSYKSRENRLKFVFFSIKKLCVCLPEEVIIDSIYKDEPTNYEQLTLDETFNKNNPELILNDIGHYLAEIPKYKNFVIRYGNELFNSEKNQKFKFLNLLSNVLTELCEEYKVALKLYQSSHNSYRTDSALSNYINFDNYSDFKKKVRELSPSLNIQPISMIHTATSDVFCLDNKNILKLGTQRYTYNIDLNFFRIIPTSIYYVKDKNGKVCAVVENQSEIDNNPEHITKEMIKELFLDFLKHGLYIADPHCLRYDPNNFGILKDYRDANLGKYKSHEELPESFKRCPLVLLDTDLIYSYDGIETPPLHMLELITSFHSNILDYEKIKQIRQKVKDGRKL